MRQVIRICCFVCSVLMAKNGAAQSLKTQISVHDPVIIREDSVYHVFSTGYGIAQWSSADMLHWKKEPPVFLHPPQWTTDSIPGFRGFFWAPDISYFNGRYYLYYAVSSFGKNNSCIGLATNQTLNTNSPEYSWKDMGVVIRSTPGKDNWNAIDPNLIKDKDGTPYLVFGSFWDGLKIVRLTADGLHVDQSLKDIPTMASRRNNVEQTSAATPVTAGDNAIEAPFIFRKGKYFYLFASIDYCCKGPQSTYKMIVGRSENLLGPYVDDNNKPMMQGGGKLVLAGDKDWYGVGHCAVAGFDGSDYLVFHGYDAHDKAISKLRIMLLGWKKGWPVIQKEIKAL